ncbi:hypothetical protein E1B28_005440 [Marasmius oreades]|uniref:Uncharacterized protein n=1 Tax=Marasmius oreades TaxID=181124 RepID=A0A9P7S366_9AGAR|nr:uncharacterized protein E1B28_005440 [Marasmius oreades]KAG7094616.1 hypothetical protein E1B28_005440 [Marasmius oreades]
MPVSVRFPGSQGIDSPHKGYSLRINTRFLEPVEGNTTPPTTPFTVALKNRQGLEDGIYQISTTQSFDNDCHVERPLYLATDSGFVKVVPEPRDNATLWRINRINTQLDTFNINSPSCNISNLVSSHAFRYRVENVGSGELLGLSRSRLTLITTKGYQDNTLKVFISPSEPPSCESGTTSTGSYKMYTILPDETSYGTLEEFYLHVGIWQLAPKGKPVVPAPVHLSSKVFPESDCSWVFDFAEGIP